MTTIIRVLKEFFPSRSVQAFLVGGYLRDSLEGRVSKDVDLAVEGDSLDLGRELAHLLGGSFVLLDETHRIGRVVVPGDRKGQTFIDLSPVLGSIEGDLARRDFTVDAMALPLEAAGTPGWQKRIIDPFGGMRDLSARLIHAVSENVFNEDPVRLLRAVRLAAELQFAIEARTTALIAQSSSMLWQVAAERVRDEFLSLLSLKEAKEHLHRLDELGLLCHIIPELEVARGVEQPKEHYWDVFEHSIQTVGAVEKLTEGSDKDTVARMVQWNKELESYFDVTISDGHNRRTLLKLGALLHDVAKPQTKTVDKEGRTRFLGHSTLGASMAQARLRSLRLSTRGIRSICAMVEYHLRPSQMVQGAEMPTPRAVYRYFRDLEETAIGVLYLSLADYLAARGPLLNLEEWQHRAALVNHVLEEGVREKAPQRRVRLVTGHDLMEVLGLEPGPHLGRLLDAVLEAQAAGEVNTRDEALAWVRSRLEGEKG